MTRVPSPLSATEQTASLTSPTIGLDAAEKKFGQGKVDPVKQRGMNEKVTDKARGMFEKATGYVVLDLTCPFPCMEDFDITFPSSASMALCEVGRNVMG